MDTWAYRCPHLTTGDTAMDKIQHQEWYRNHMIAIQGDRAKVITNGVVSYLEIPDSAILRIDDKVKVVRKALDNDTLQQK